MVRFILSLAIVTSLGPAGAFAADKSAEPATVSYYRNIRPILQQHCQGCHQPARAKGGFVMTSYADLLKPGDSGSASIVPGQPDKSHVVE